MDFDALPLPPSTKEEADALAKSNVLNSIICREMRIEPVKGDGCVHFNFSFPTWYYTCVSKECRDKFEFFLQSDESRSLLKAQMKSAN